MKILHLEMNRFFSRVIEKVSIESGHEYRKVQGIEEGLAALEEWKYDLLITSRILVDGRAETLLQSIADTKFRDIPVIVITSDDSIEIRERFFALGVMDYLLKSDLIPRKLALYFRVIDMGGEILEELRNLRVAVLDDSDVSLHVIRSIFLYYGIDHAEYFSSPREMLGADSFDLYIIDMVMPGKSGDEVILAIKGQGDLNGVILVSGVSNRNTMAYALSLGADDYILKPFDSREFIARVKGVVRHLLLLRELEDKSRQMEDLVKKDSLTGLWNHGYIHEFLEHLVSGDDSGPVSVALFDLDHFKTVNDRHGHQAGDDILLAISDLLETHFGDAGVVGRYGGEEFLIVLPGMKSDEARERSEHILRHIRKLNLGIRGLSVTASCGVADSGETEASMKLVELADQRLYAAKAAGRDRVSN